MPQQLQEFDPEEFAPKPKKKPTAYPQKSPIGELLGTMWGTDDSLLPPIRGVTRPALPSSEGTDWQGWDDMKWLYENVVRPSSSVVGSASDYLTGKAIGAVAAPVIRKGVDLYKRFKGATPELPPIRNVEAPVAELPPVKPTEVLDASGRPIAPPQTELPVRPTGPWDQNLPEPLPVPIKSELSKPLPPLPVNENESIFDYLRRNGVDNINTTPEEQVANRAAQVVDTPEVSINKPAVNIADYNDWIEQSLRDYEASNIKGGLRKPGDPEKIIIPEIGMTEADIDDLLNIRHNQSRNEALKTAFPGARFTDDFLEKFPQLKGKTINNIDGWNEGAVSVTTTDGKSMVVGREDITGLDIPSGRDYKNPVIPQTRSVMYPDRFDVEGNFIPQTGPHPTAVKLAENRIKYGMPPKEPQPVAKFDPATLGFESNVAKQFDEMEFVNPTTGEIKPASLAEPGDVPVIPENKIGEYPSAFPDTDPNIVNETLAGNRAGPDALNLPDEIPVPNKPPISPSNNSLDIAELSKLRNELEAMPESMPDHPGYPVWSKRYAAVDDMITHAELGSPKPINIKRRVTSRMGSPDLGPVPNELPIRPETLNTDALSRPALDPTQPWTPVGEMPTNQPPLMPVAPQTPFQPAGIPRQLGPKPPRVPPMGPTKPPPPARPLVPNQPPQGPISNALSTWKAWLTSNDISGPGRQGKAFIFNKAWWSSWDDMAKAWSSKAASDAVADSITNHPSGFFQRTTLPNGRQTQSWAEQMGLELPKHEEMFSGSIGKKIDAVTGIERSSRAHTAFLNKLRSDQFVSMIEASQKAGVDPLIRQDLAKMYAKFINEATGRGSLNIGRKVRLERISGELSNAFFAPRNMSGQIRTWNNVLNPVKYYNYDPVLRKQALKSLFAVAGLGTGIGELARLGGAQVSNDPTSSDFRKIKFGDTRIDMFGGYQQFPVAAMKFMTGLSTSTINNKTTDLTAGRFGQRTRKDVGESFFVNRLSPLGSFIWAWMDNREFDGKPFEVKKAIYERVFPIAAKDMWDLAQEDPAIAAAMAIPTMTGLASTQHYTGR